MLKFGASTAAFVIYITCTSAQNYLSRGWKPQDLSQYPDIVMKINIVISTVSGSSSYYTGYKVLSLYIKVDVFGEWKYFAIYQDGTETPCRLSWTDRGRGEPPSDINGPSCGFDVCGGGDDSNVGIYSAARSVPSGL